MRFRKTAEAVFLLFITLVSSSGSLIALAGDANITRSGNLQTPLQESNDADVTRYRNLQTPYSVPNNADVTRHRNLQSSLSGPNNADVIRYRDLQSPFSSPNNADVIRTGNLNTPQLTTDWDDDDLDGIPNYLDSDAFTVSSYSSTLDLFGMNWYEALWYITPRTSVQDMQAALQEWGVGGTGAYDYSYGVIADVGTPFPNAEDFMNWLKQYFPLDIGISEFAARLHEISGSDSRLRLLVLVQGVSGSDPEITAYWLVDHSPIAPVLIALAFALPPIIQIASKAVKAFRGKYDLQTALYEIGWVLVHTAITKMLDLIGIGILFAWGNALDELKNMILGDPYYDLASYDPEGNLVLGYDNGTIISTSNYGLYFGRTDGLQMMILSNQTLPHNLAITLHSESQRSYTGYIQPSPYNATIIEGLLAPNETVSGRLYRAEGTIKVTRLLLDYNISDAHPFKGDIVPMTAHVKDENMTAIDDAMVQISVGNQTIPFSSLGNGTYTAFLNTSMLQYGDSTVMITAGHANCFSVAAAVTITVRFKTDLPALSRAYGATPSMPNWNSSCDVNNDLVVDVIDLFMQGKNYGDMQADSTRDPSLSEGSLGIAYVCLSLCTVFAPLMCLCKKRKESQNHPQTLSTLK